MKMNFAVIVRCAVILILTAFAGACAIHKTYTNPPDVVPHVDLERYMGTWYEIARYPNRFEKGCVDVTATYTLRQDGKVTVLNECIAETPKEKRKSIQGVAWVPDPTANAKLKVRFFWPFSADYWIIHLDDNYEYAVVSHPSRKYLWILYRKPEMDDSLYNSILDLLRKKEFDLTPLYKTPQQGHL